MSKSFSRVGLLVLSLVVPLLAGFFDSWQTAAGVGPAVALLLREADKYLESRASSKAVTEAPTALVDPVVVVSATVPSVTP